MKKSLILILLIIFAFFSFVGTKAFSASSSSYSITAKIISISRKEYNDTVIMRRKYKVRGITKVFMKLKILRAGYMIKKGADDPGVTYRVGQIVDVYAYEEVDFLSSKLIEKNDVINVTIVAIPVGVGEYSYKVSRIKRR